MNKIINTCKRNIFNGTGKVDVRDAKFHKQNFHNRWSISIPVYEFYDDDKRDN